MMTGLLQRGYNAIRGRAERALPRNFHVGDPIVQLFLGGKRTTRYTFTNICSFFAPSSASPCRYQLTLYDAHGFVVTKAQLDVPPFGTAEWVPADSLKKPLPEVGMVAATFRDVNPLQFGNQHLGTVFPHFFALYHDEHMASVALVHPQTHLNAAGTEGTPWKKWSSKLFIDPHRLQALEVFQINPLQHEQESTLLLRDPSGTVLASATARLPPFGARGVRWAIDAAVRERASVIVAVDGMTTANAKPIIFSVFEGGFFSASHG
jgi:hypothetical protein